MKIYWGETHQNTYTSKIQPVPMPEVLAFARSHLDFYAGAYYLPVMSRIAPLPERMPKTAEQIGGHPVEQGTGPAWLGFWTETTKPLERIEREWKELETALAAAHEPGRFVTFPGFEWQGDGTWGDHNVMYKREGLPVHCVESLPELYARLRGMEAIAIPHHIGYQRGIRAPRWEHCDEMISPYTEIFSIHGCSETDEERMGGLRHNSHMGPGFWDSSYQAALNRGLHLGAVCSTDNWQNVPGCWGQGVMACLARELTRDGLWDAFRSRRVYGVTGDRIELNFTVNDAPMGSILPSAPKRKIEVAVRGWDAIDRIELLRNGRVIATHNHQGTWDLPVRSSRYRLRIETGWGPRLGELPFGEHRWNGEIQVAGGRFTGWSPCWTGRGQGTPILDGSRAEFRLVSAQSAVGNPFQVGLVLEFEALPGAELALKLNGQTVRDTVAGFAGGSRLVWYKDECLAMLRELTGMEPAALDRQDPLIYHSAFKAKLYRAIPEQGYTAQLSFTDDEPLTRETHYRVRVEQRNGQRAWSSPVWVGSSPVSS